MTEALDETRWWQQAIFRLQSHWPLKVLGTMAVMTAFMVVYLSLMLHPQFPITTIPWTPLDRLIGFRPWSIVPYSSLWLYIALVPALLLLRWELAPYLSAVLVLSLIGFTIFLFWPTTVVQPDVDWSRYPAIDLLKSVDDSGNACPSMHVAFSVLTSLWLHRLLRRIGGPAILRGVNASWCLLILWSALALKQHLVLDLVAGAALALVVALPHLYLFPALDRDPDRAASSSE